MSEPKTDLIAAHMPQPARATLALFGDALRDVRFPDVDYLVLAAAADELREAQLEVECIESALEQARAQVRDRSQHLNAQAERALAYARIYAAGNVALSTQVGEIERLGRATASTANEPAKRRGRARKDTQGTGLFSEDAASTSSGEGAEVAA